MTGFLRSTRRTPINIEKDHLIPIMKTSPMNRSHSAALLALALGLAAASSVEAATTAKLWTSANTNGTDFAAGYATDVMPQPGYGNAYWFHFLSSNLSFVLSGDMMSPDPLVSDGTDLAGFSGSPEEYLRFMPGYITNGLQEGTDNYALVKGENGGAYQYYVVQFSKSGISLDPIAWAQGDDSGFNIAAGKTAIDALSTSAVPEASTSLGLLALGAGGVLTRRRFKRKA